MQIMAITQQSTNNTSKMNWRNNQTSNASNQNPAFGMDLRLTGSVLRLHTEKTLPAGFVDELINLKRIAGELEPKSKQIFLDCVDNRPILANSPKLLANSERNSVQEYLLNVNNKKDFFQRAEEKVKHCSLLPDDEFTTL